LSLSTSEAYQISLSVTETGFLFHAACEVKIRQAALARDSNMVILVFVHGKLAFRDFRVLSVSTSLAG